MLERIFWSSIGSFGLWLALAYFTSEPTPQGRALSRFAFYADATLACAVYILLFVVFALPLIYLYCLDLSTAENSTALVRTDDTAIWPPTTVGHLEDLKSELRNIEDCANYLRYRERQVRKRYTDGACDFELWLAERGLSIIRYQCRNAVGTANKLRHDIARIYDSGDVDPEVRDYQEAITELRRQRDSGDPDSFVTQWINDGIDRKIRRCERNIIELREWQKRVTAATAPGPYQAAWRNFVDLARRNAAAPLVEAVARLQADRAGIDIKRHYESLVDRELRQGRLSHHEAAFIRQRIREEFLGGARNFSA